jgi:general secretion pathway protein G
MTKQKYKSGFTLIEMLLVLTIIGLLAAVVVAKFSGTGKKARIDTTRASVSALCTAIDAYEIDCGTYPSSLQGLVKSSGEPNWHGPYIGGADIPMDAWGTPFGYVPRENDFEVRSAGPDKAMNTSDDITN